MIIQCTDMPLCCDSHPILNTWDDKEMRSIYCEYCGNKTNSHFRRVDAYDDWVKKFIVKEVK